MNRSRPFRPAPIRPRRTRRRLLVIAAVVLTMAACETSREEDPAASVEGTSQTSREEAIRQAALAYVREETAVPDATVRIESVGEGWARVHVFAVDDRTDPAVMYLREDAGTWRAVTIGTAFAPDELDRLGVARSVRPRE